MFGNSEKKRSQDQGGCREALSAKEGGGKGTAVGTRTGSEAAMRAMSVLGNAKSKSHRKTHRVEPDGTGRRFTPLTRGGFRGESAGGISRGRRSEDARGNSGGATGQSDRARRDRRTAPQAKASRYPKPTGCDNYGRLPEGVRGTCGWNPATGRVRGDQVWMRARGGSR
jgi:hypothetical protein